MKTKTLSTMALALSVSVALVSAASAQIDSSLVHRGFDAQTEASVVDVNFKKFKKFKKFSHGDIGFVVKKKSISKYGSFAPKKKVFKPKSFKKGIAIKKKFF